MIGTALARLFGPRKAFGRGKRALVPTEVEEALRLKGLGLSTNQVAQRTGLNWRTVKRLWADQQPLAELVDDLGKAALKRDPALRRQVAKARAVAQAQEGRPALVPSPAARTSPQATFQPIVRKLMAETIKRVSWSDPKQLVEWGSALLQRVVYGDGNFQEAVKWATLADPRHRDRLLELTVEKEEVEAAVKAAKRHPQKRPRAGSEQQAFLKKVQAIDRRQQASKNEVLAVVQAAVGPGGALTEWLSRKMRVPAPPAGPGGPPPPGGLFPVSTPAPAIAAIGPSRRQKGRRSERGAQPTDQATGGDGTGSGQRGGPETPSGPPHLA